MAHTRYRGKDGRFTKPPSKGRKVLTVEQVDKRGRIVSKRKRTVRGRKPPAFKPSVSGDVIWQGSNRGKRFDEMIEEHGLDRKITYHAGRGRRVITVEVNTKLPSGETIRGSRKFLAAQKGRDKTHQNYIILLETLIHVLDGKGIKLYAKKFRVGANKRTPTADHRATQIIIKAGKPRKVRRSTKRKS